MTEASEGNKDSLRHVVFATRHEPLRDDVRWLGAMVGDVIREQGGQDLFQKVEAARRGSIRARESGIAAVHDQEQAALAGTAPAVAEDLVRSFSTYFQVVNLAEKTHRIRRRRSYESKQQTQPSGFAARLVALKKSGVSFEQVCETLGRLVLEPVFTAHPTEATRRSLLEKEQRIARLLVERLVDQSSRHRASLESQVRLEVTAGWQTLEHTAARPTVGDEREHVLFYLGRVLYRIVPRFYEELERALVLAFGDEAIGFRVPTFLSFSSWVGGDMDGNPNVVAATIGESLERHRNVVLSLYLDELTALSQRLTQTVGRATFSVEIEQRSEALAGLFPAVLASVPERHRDMPYRVLLAHMRGKLEATLQDSPEGYGGSLEFAHDLELVATSLRANLGERAGLFSVERALRRVETFGFHLAGLDCRQDSEVHRQTVAEVLDEPDWLQQSPEARTERLRLSLEDADSVSRVGLEKLSEASRGALDVFAAIHRCRARFGERAVGPYIISMAENVDDVLSVLLLARVAGCVQETAGEEEPGSQTTVPLDVAPLFETVPDLERSAEVLGSLAIDPLYQEHLRSRGFQQMVMLGYSDSCKDGGIGASRWALQKGQGELARVAAEHSLRLVLFHGRGGTIGRGGGNTDQALLGAPLGAVAGTLRVTEQGEVIDEKFGLRPIALRTLDRSAGSLLVASLRDAGVDSGCGVDLPNAEARTVMDLVAESSRKRYRALVYEDDRFYLYFRQATPIDVIERLRLGSRPSSRRAQRGIEDLRAIPWVFSWSQCRHVLPGWYGLGAGLKVARDQVGIAELRRWLANWPFFRNLLSDAEMALGKADLGIGREYAQLSEKAVVFETVEEEFEHTVAAILEIREADELLASAPTLRRAIRLRNPYIDPMSRLQVDLLERWRAGGREDEDILKALIGTVNGISRGLQNTG